MLELCSTRNPSLTMTAKEAVLRGLAPDGGLFAPAEIPHIGIEGLENADYRTIAKRVMAAFLPGFTEEQLARVADGAYDDKFSSPDVTPVVRVGDRYVLELFHGPTAAFKDVALSALPRLMSEARAEDADPRPIRVVVATSGDTGSAALTGFADVPGTGILVFYPEKGISEVQRRQMVAARGSNLGVYAVRGNFDDAQRGVKRAFAEIGDEVRLSSANSINYARLVPQIVYYYAAYIKLVREGAVSAGDKVNFSVPTGNFGDILAGWYAKMTGLPVGRLMCASNSNNVLTELISTGRYDRNRQFYVTLSPSMDILVSSNFERLLFHLTGDGALVAECMRRLETEGRFVMPAAAYDAMCADFCGASVDDAQTKRTIAEVFRSESYLLDPHTAVAWHAVDTLKEKGGAPWVVLSTASPYKFASTVLSALGLPVPEDGMEQPEALEKATGTVMPRVLREALERPVRFNDVTDRDDIADVIRKAGSTL